MRREVIGGERPYVSAAPQPNDLSRKVVNLVYYNLEYERGVNPAINWPAIKNVTKHGVEYVRLTYRQSLLMAKRFDFRTVNRKISYVDRNTAISSFSCFCPPFLFTCSTTGWGSCRTEGTGAGLHPTVTVK
jgi:hypothetical protein